MLFSSILFVWIFLPVTLLFYYIVPNISCKNIVLLLSSFLFYAWGGPSYLLLMLCSITLNWLCGLGIHYTKKRVRTFVLALSVLLNLGILGYFKYASFLFSIIGRFLHGSLPALPEIALPIGISFYTFQAISYLVDLYRGQVKVQKNWLWLALYISFFPQLIAGPIVQYPVVEHALSQRTVSLAGFSYGIKRFLYGLSKKVLIANAMAVQADAIFGLELSHLSTPLAWLGAVFYTLQIYYDFSGYSDMAIGLGSMFGFHFPENFNYPYLADSITDFWRRWHISLSSWFKNYLYIPLGGNRKGLPRKLLNLWIVFLATGLWHGASWQFIAWGVWYGLLLCAENLFLLKRLERIPAWLRHLYTMLFVTCGWVIFRAPGLTEGLARLKTMFVFTKADGLFPCGRFLDPRVLLLLCIAVLFCGPVQRLFPKLKTTLFAKSAPGLLQGFFLLILLFLCLVQLVSGTYNPFIYFRF